MLPWLLNRAVFLSLGDMGFPLPEYSEIPVPVEMAPEQLPVLQKMIVKAANVARAPVIVATELLASMDTALKKLQ